MTLEEAGRIHDASGIKLTDIMQRLHGRPLDFSEIVKQSGEVHAFIELHIEQANRLYSQGINIGVVDRIAAPTDINVTVYGE